MNATYEDSLLYESFVISKIGMSLFVIGSFIVSFICCFGCALTTRTSLLICCCGCPTAFLTSISTAGPMRFLPESTTVTIYDNIR